MSKPDPMTVIVVAGGAPVTRENIEDLIKDFLLIDTKDEKEFRIFLPADVDFIGDAVVHTAAFLTDLNESYTAVRGASSGTQVGNSLKVKKIARGADDVLKVEGDDKVATYLIDILKDARDEGNEVFLFLAWGDGDEAPDDVTDDLAELAVEAEIPVKDLTGGLDDLPFEANDDDESESAEDAEEEPPAEEKPARKRPVKELKETERELPTDEAQTDVPGQIEGQPAIPDLVTVLAFVAQKLDFEDRANAANQMQPSYSRPLTRAVRHHLKQLMAKAPSNAELETRVVAAEPVQEPLPDAEEEKPRPRRGKARSTAEDLVKVYVNEANKTARLVPGRGRPKKGEEPQEMLRSEYQELLDSGEYTPF